MAKAEAEAEAEAEVEAEAEGEAGAMANADADADAEAGAEAGAEAEVVADAEAEAVLPVGTHAFAHDVYIEDTDAYGVAFYASYFRVAANARFAAGCGAAPARVKVARIESARYSGSAVLGTRLEVQSEFCEERSGRVRHIMRDAGSGEELWSAQLVLEAGGGGQSEVRRQVCRLGEVSVAGLDALAEPAAYLPGLWCRSVGCV